MHTAQAAVLKYVLCYWHSVSAAVCVVMICAAVFVGTPLSMPVAMLQYLHFIHASFACVLTALIGY